MMQYCC